MSARKIVICDIDGTLADITHRIHHVKGGKREWDEFFAKCGDDAPVLPVIEVLNNFADAGYHIILVSGRSDAVEKETIAWLDAHGVYYDEIYMRPAGDYRKDTILKKDILSEIYRAFPDEEVLCVLDDRPSVVRMWRDNGLLCLQVAEWNEWPRAGLGVMGLLSLMIGPSGAGKSDWLTSGAEVAYGIHLEHVISTDKLRRDLSVLGDFKDQTKNEAVFKALHDIVSARLRNGLPVVVDATNIRRKDRLALVEMTRGGPVRYFVMDRPMVDKRASGGWRNELEFDLIGKHDQTFKSQVAAILLGDGLPGIEVIDLRNIK